MKTMTTHKKLLSLTALTAVLGASLLGVQNAHAEATANVEVNAAFLTALELGNITDMDFGTVGVSAALPAAATVLLSTDGNLTESGGIFQPAATGTPGSIQITAGSAGTNVDIFCDSSATLAASGSTSTIDVNGIGFDFAGNEGGTAGGNTCAGGTSSDSVAGSVSDISSDDTLTFGATLDGSTANSFDDQDTHSTSNTGNGGVPIQVTVAY